mgnify:CR=1 FL=1
MKKRDGASLLNVMVFMLFAVMITAQVFFFAKWQADSVAEEREIMMYRLNLDSLVEDAKDALKKTGDDVISHDIKLDENALKFSEFYDGPASGTYANRGTQVRYWRNNAKWEIPADWKGEGYKDKYNLTIHDLDYSFDVSGFDRTNWTENYSGKFMYKKVFAAMLPLGDFARYTSGDKSGDIIPDKVGKPTYTTVNNRFFLIRAWAQLPENYYDMKLMYQVLVSRDEPNHNDVQVLSFQEVWFK